MNLEDATISNDATRVEYLNQDSEDRSVFKLTDLRTGVDHTMAFSLKYYNPTTGDDPSGQYIFKPKHGDYDKRPYSDFVKIETYKGAATGVHCFAVYYSDPTKARMYTALIRLVPGELEEAIEWDVLLHGIPIDDDGLGKEVVVNWELLDFDN